MLMVKSLEARPAFTEYIARLAARPALQRAEARNAAIRKELGLESLNPAVSPRRSRPSSRHCRVPPRGSPARVTPALRRMVAASANRLPV